MLSAWIAAYILARGRVVCLPALRTLAARLADILCQHAVHGTPKSVELAKESQRGLAASRHADVALDTLMCLSFLERDALLNRSE